jgi:transcriptional regulator with XRE-family HTH domain
MARRKERADSRLGDAIGRIRRELGVDQEVFGRRMGVSGRTLSRWETGRVVPTRAQCEAMLPFLAGASPESVRAFEEAAGLRDPAPPHAAPEPSPDSPDSSHASRPSPAPAAALPDLHAAVDDAVRAYAEDLDVSARRLRLVLAMFLGDLERLALPVPRARELVARRRPAPPG